MILDFDVTEACEIAKGGEHRQPITNPEAREALILSAGPAQPHRGVNVAREHVRAIDRTRMVSEGEWSIVDWRIETANT
jgi:hypothetical protein